MVFCLTYISTFHFVQILIIQVCSIRCECSKHCAQFRRHGKTRRFFCCCLNFVLIIIIPDLATRAAIISLSGGRRCLRSPQLDHLRIERGLHDCATTRFDSVRGGPMLWSVSDVGWLPHLVIFALRPPHCTPLVWGQFSIIACGGSSLAYVVPGTVQTRHPPPGAAPHTAHVGRRLLITRSSTSLSSCVRVHAASGWRDCWRVGLMSLLPFSWSVCRRHVFVGTAAAGRRSCSAGVGNVAQRWFACHVYFCCLFVGVACGCS